jgi:hypothetical protein
VTLAGTVNAPELSESGIVAPPLGAGVVKLTVPVADLPPITLSGVCVRLLRRGGPPVVISNSALCPGLPGRSAWMFKLN